MGLAYVVWQPTAFFQVLRNGGYVSVGSWANPVFRFLDLFMTGLHAKIVVGVISYAGLIVIAWMLSRTVPWTAVPGLPKGADLRRDPLTIALRTSLVLSVAWLITSMYTLSWYDLIAWVPLAVLATGKLDRIMLLRSAPLSLAYVPGRAIEVRARLDFGVDPDAGHHLPDRPVRRAAGRGAVVAAAGPARAVPVPPAGAGPAALRRRRPGRSRRPRSAARTPKPPPTVTGSRSRSPGLSGSRRR